MQRSSAAHSKPGRNEVIDLKVIFGALDKIDSR
jgi:hypothetical protein